MKEACESAGKFPLCPAQMGPASKGKGAVTLLSSMYTDGKGHNHGYPSYSSGVLIKEDEQKTIAGSLLLESQILECRLKKNGKWNCWALKGVGVEKNQEERNISLC